MGLYEHFPYSNFHELNLDWILDQMKILDSKLDELDAVLAKLDEYTQAFNDLTAKYNQLESDFNVFKSDVNTQLADGMQNLNNRFADLTALLNGQYATFTNNVHMIIDALSAEISNLDSELQEVINGLQNAIILFNPLTGEENTLQQIIYYLASLHMTDALTASEYDALDMTATYYDGKDLTAYQYDSAGKTLLP